MDVPIAKSFFLVLLPFAKMPCQLENSPRCVLGMLATCIRKSKNSNYPLPVGSLQISSSFDQAIGRLTNKFRHCFSETGGVRGIRKSMAVGDVADHNARFVLLRLAIERAVGDTTKFLFRKVIREN